jgi:hypothetical protein
MMEKPTEEYLELFKDLVQVLPVTIVLCDLIPALRSELNTLTQSLIEAEREACAKIADAVYVDEKTWSDSHAATARIIAERIRLRGE